MPFRLPAAGERAPLTSCLPACLTSRPALPQGPLGPGMYLPQDGMKPGGPLGERPAGLPAARRRNRLLGGPQRLLPGSRARASAAHLCCCPRRGHVDTRHILERRVCRRHAAAAAGAGQRGPARVSEAGEREGAPGAGLCCRAVKAPGLHRQPPGWRSGLALPRLPRLHLRLLHLLLPPPPPAPRSNIRPGNLVQDSLSVMATLGPQHFQGFHKYGVDWQPGEYIRWCESPGGGCGGAVRLLVRQPTTAWSPACPGGHARPPTPRPRSGRCLLPPFFVCRPG